MYYVGLDLHKKYITGCVLDSQGAVVAEQRRLPPVLETLLGWLAPVGQPVAVALEATLYWAWLHDRLTAAGYQVAVAHPQQVKLICHARCKTDPVDARKLADLLRTELLPAIWIPDAETRARRTLLRGRAWVVRTRTRVKARIQAYLAAENERVPVSDLFMNRSLTGTRSFSAARYAWMRALTRVRVRTTQARPRRSVRRARVSASGIQIAGSSSVRSRSASLRASTGSVLQRA